MFINCGEEDFNNDADPLVFYKSFTGAIKFNLMQTVGAVKQKLKTKQCSMLGHDIDVEQSISIEEQICARCGAPGPIAYIQNLQMQKDAVMEKNGNVVQKSKWVLS